MLKRLILALFVILLVCASGCDFFPAPSVSPTATTPATASPAWAATATTATLEPTLQPTEGLTEAPTEMPTEAPTDEPAATPDPKEGMIFPGSDSELTPWEDLVALDAKKLDLARNEIFAREGYEFTKDYYTEYFSKFSWYEVDPSFSQSMFSEIQLANIHLIQAAEKVVNGQLFEITSGLKLDYDMDGQLETLTYAASDENITVKIRDGDATTTWSIDDYTPSKKVYLGDIDFSDGMLDLFADVFGPSDDNYCYVAGLKHRVFLDRTANGSLPGVIGDIKLDGNGKIATTKRMKILMAWFCKVGYKLNSSGDIIFVPQSSYPMGNFRVKTKVDIPLKETADASSDVLLTVPAGTQVTLVSTDDEKWIKIKAPDGTGWLEMTDYYTLADPNVFAESAFDGIILAS